MDTLEELRREIKRSSLTNLAAGLYQCPEAAAQDDRRGSPRRWSASSQGSVFRKRHETSLVEGAELMGQISSKLQKMQFQKVYMGGFGAPSRAAYCSHTSGGRNPALAGERASAWGTLSS